MAPSQQSNRKNGNVRQTNHNACGAPAPRGTIKKPSGHSTTTSRAKKVIPRSSVIPKGGSLAFINSGRGINQGDVRCLFIITIISLLMRGFSGAATVSMVGQLLFAQCVRPFRSARHALISKVKKPHFSAHLAF